MSATSHRQALELGASAEDFVWDYRHGYIQFPRHEPDLSGHVFNALQLAADHGTTHVLQELGLYYRRSFTNDIVLARAFNARGTPSFNELLATVYEPEVLEKQLEDHCTMKRLADEAFAKALNGTATKIDFSLAPEPTRFEQVLP